MAQDSSNIPIQIGFQTQFPERGRKPENNYWSPELYDLLELSNPIPRKGTETLSEYLAMYWLTKTFKPNSPKGDGNNSSDFRILLYPLTCALSNPIPRKGTETRTGRRLAWKFDRDRTLSNPIPRKGTETKSNN